MQSAQFVMGKIDGIQKHFISADLRAILPPTKLSELENLTELGEYPRFFKKELVLAKSIVSEAENTDNRRGGIINHTVLYKWQPTLTHDGASYIFDLDTFISEILSGERRFKMPPIPQLPDADSGLIDAPSPIEWEV